MQIFRKIYSVILNFRGKICHFLSENWYFGRGRTHGVWLWSVGGRVEIDCVWLATFCREGRPTVYDLESVGRGGGSHTLLHVCLKLLNLELCLKKAPAGRVLLLALDAQQVPVRALGRRAGRVELPRGADCARTRPARRAGEPVNRETSAKSRLVVYLLASRLYSGDWFSYNMLCLLCIDFSLFFRLGLVIYPS